MTLNINPCARVISLALFFLSCSLDMAAQCWLRVKVDPNPAPWRSGPNQVQATGWQEPREDVYFGGTWSVDTITTIQFQPLNDSSRLDVITHTTTANWIPGVTPRGFAGRSTSTVSTDLNPRGNGYYRTKVRYVGRCGGQTIPIAESDTVSGPVLITRPSAPDYQSGSPALWYLGPGITSNGAYSAQTVFTPGVANGATPGCQRTLFQQALRGYL